MATIGMVDIKKNVRLIIGDVPYKVVEFQHVKPGKGGAFVRTKLKNLITGRVLDNTFRAGEPIEVVRVERKK